MNLALFYEAENELYTILDVIRWAASRFEEAGLFYGHGTDNAWDEASALVLALLHLPPDSPSELYACRLTSQEKKDLFKALQKRIIDHVPVAYLSHTAWFADMSFYVDQRVLIPRSPLAELIKHRFSPWCDDMSIERIADVCTGSGCIACALAVNFPEAQVDALDISPDALVVAARNCTDHGLDAQLEIIESDLLGAVLDRKYDLIISNPPYVNEVDMAALPAEYRHEPKLGLAGGTDGLDLIEPLLQQAKACLNPSGIIVVEVGFSQEALETRYPEVPFMWLEFAHGGQGVFLLTKAQLDSYF